MLYRVYTISKEQGKKMTVTFVDEEEKAEEMCKEHILYAYEPIDLKTMSSETPRVHINY